MIKTILIAPTSTLEYAEKEVQNVVNLLHAEILLGDGATKEAVFNKLGTEDYELIWFAGHSSEAGLELNSGEIFSASELGQFLSKASPPALFLNSCSSLPVAIQINDWLKCDVIATVSEVADLEAYHTGVLFARALAAGRTLRDAYNRSKTLHVQYVFLPGAAGIATDIEGLRSDVTKLSYLVEDIEHRREEQWAKYRKESDERYHPRLGNDESWYWLVAFALFSINVILFYSDVRELLNVNWVAALIIALCLLPMSCYFFMRGLRLPIRPRLIAVGAYGGSISLFLIAVYNL